jgi:hypothetical protein
LLTSKIGQYEEIRRIHYEWYIPISDQTIRELDDKLAEINADAVLNATRMMIK